jgi:hypothetical protein
MRKQLLALLSMIGLAGSSAPASAQVLKGSTQPDKKTESQLKRSKAQQENQANKNAHFQKTWRKSTNTDSFLKLNNQYKEDKAQQENKANKSAASKDAAKMTKQYKENKAQQENKANKSAAYSKHTFEAKQKKSTNAELEHKNQKDIRVQRIEDQTKQKSDKQLKENKAAAAEKGKKATVKF